MDTVSAPHGTADLPEELQRWNWGAFLLNWIWGLGNRCYFALLTFVPFFGLAVPFILGVKGNAWAWRSGKWESVAAFQRAQRRWTQGALLAWAGMVLFAVALFFGVSAGLQRTAAFALAQAAIDSDPRVTQALGAPLRVSNVAGSIAKKGGGNGEADLSFSVTGPIQSARAYVGARARADQWTLERLELALDDGSHIVLTETTQSALTAAPPPRSGLEPELAPARPVTLASRGTDIHGALPRKLVDTAFDEQLAQLAPCFSHSDAPASTLTLKLVIAPTGAVQTAALVDASVEPEVATCVSRQAERFSFPKPKRAGIAVVQHSFAVQR